MRLPLLLLFFYISYVTSNDKYAVKSFPKKVKPFGSGKILINSGKYVSKNKTLDLLALPELQKPVKNNNVKSQKYTAFQEIGNTKVNRGGVPDSPYFSLDQTSEPKSRVKKVLPDYVWSSLKAQKKLRIKRNADKVNTHVVTHSKTAAASPSNAPVKEVKAKPVAKSAVHTTEEKKSNPTTAIKAEGTVKKAISKVPVKQETKPHTKHAVPAKAVKKIIKTRKHPSALRSGSKPKSKGKARGKTAKKNKNVKGRGKSKAKSKQSSRNRPLRKPKANSGRKKTKRASKRHTRRTGNSTVTGNSTIKLLPDTRRLTGARQASIENYPYVVSILKDGEHWCTGALLNQRVVITTANCLWKANRISRMEVRAGSSYTTYGGQLANIQEVIKHPRWGLRKNPDNDVALMLLDRNIKFSDSCHGVDLPNRVMLPAFDDAWVVSYGAERRDGMYDIHYDGLQVYHTFLMSNETCNNVTTRFGVTVTENFICFTQSGKTSPCTRDTGAPAVSDGVVWGLASWGIRKLCGTERFPSMFSYLASHSNMDFIADATRRLMSEKRIYQFLDRTFVPKVKFVPTMTPKDRIG